MGFSVLEHSVLERKFAPLFQADFVFYYWNKVLDETNSYSGYKFHIFNYFIHSFAYNEKVNQDIVLAFNGNETILCCGFWLFCISFYREHYKSTYLLYPCY